MADITTIRANAIKAPPAWAVMERRLIDLMEEATLLAAEQYDKHADTPAQLFPAVILWRYDAGLRANQTVVFDAAVHFKIEGVFPELASLV